MRVFQVIEPVFKTEPLFVVGCTYAELGVYLRRRFHVDVDKDDGQTGQMLTFARAPWRVVWSQRLDPGVVLHETFHLVTRICADKGVVIRAHNERGECDDETAAYLFEHFARGALRKMGVSRRARRDR